MLNSSAFVFVSSARSGVGWAQDLVLFIRRLYTLLFLEHNIYQRVSLWMMQEAVCLSNNCNLSAATYDLQISQQVKKYFP